MQFFDIQVDRTHDCYLENYISQQFLTDIRHKTHIFSSSMAMARSLTTASSRNSAAVDVVNDIYTMTTEYVPSAQLFCSGSPLSEWRTEEFTTCLKYRGECYGQR